MKLSSIIDGFSRYNPFIMLISIDTQLIILYTGNVFLMESIFDKSVLCFLSGVLVLTVIATDADKGNNGTVTYSLKQVPMKDGGPIFDINQHTGLITTTMSNALDREVQESYLILVQAKDQGTPEAKSCKYQFVVSKYILRFCNIDKISFF